LRPRCTDSRAPADSGGRRTPASRRRLIRLTSVLACASTVSALASVGQVSASPAPIVPHVVAASAGSAAGATGATGASGSAGASGASGATGASRAIGASGPSGQSGPTGGASSATPTPPSQRSVTSSAIGAASPTPTTASWRSLSNLPPDIAVLNAVSCPEAELCIAVGQATDGQGIIIETSDGAADWSTVSVTDSSPLPPLYAISCLPLSSCVAAGGDETGGDDGSATGIVLYATGPSGPFSAVSGPPGTGSVDAVERAARPDDCYLLACDPISGYEDEVGVSTSGGASRR
jgi:hypothetical protein